VSSILYDYLQSQQIDPTPILERLEHIDRPLGTWLQKQCQQYSRPWIIGINGAQGTGKSTFAATLQILLREEFQLQSLVLSLDDYYLSKEQRLQRAAAIHPLLVTRGVPGTHDIELLNVQLSQLSSIKPGGAIRLPHFDKATDDRSSSEPWCCPSSGIDLILLEGWCVGARAQQRSLLLEPINELERQQDKDAVWRSYVNQQLEDSYSTLFQQLDCLLMLQVPSFDVVVEWRQLQEQKLKQHRLGGGMSNAAVRDFVSYFERLTRHMLVELPQCADVVLPLGWDHQIQSIRFNQQSKDGFV
jgi:D-glycerate 3-kinase